MKMFKLEKIILIAISSVAVLSSIIVPTASYISYKHYYDNAIANKPKPSNNQTYDEPILQSISVRLQDGKAFYKNGKANPVKTDFVVEGTYAISKLETITDEISPSDYNMEIPSDFAINGGTISVSYKEFTSSIDITLIDVKLSSLYPLTMPYKVYYKVGETFDDEGLTLEAKYNDGTIINVDKFVIENKTLATSTKNIKISFTKDNETVDYLLPITVVEEKDYDNGDIVSIDANDTYASAGLKLSTNNFILRATYASGNKLLLTSKDYTIVNGDDIVTLGDKTILKLNINGKQIDVDINVSSKVEAISGTLENATAHSDYVSFISDSSATFKFTASHNFMGNIKLKLRSTFKDSKLNDLLRVTVNNSLNSIDKNVVISKENEFEVLSINDVKLFKGNNNIAIKCLKDSFDLGDIDVTSTGSNLKDTTLGEFVMSNDSVEFNRECVFGEGTPAAIDGFTHVQGGCSDDNYIYYLFADELNHEAKLTKYSIEEKTFVSKSNKFLIGPDSKDWTWDSGNITLIKDKIIVTNYQGKFQAFDKETLTEVACPEFKFPDFSTLFADWDESGSITAFEYNEKLDIYALSVRPVWWYSNSFLLLFDGDFNQIGEKITLESNTDVKWGGYKMRSLQSNDNYLYVLYGEESYKNAVVQIYSWNGTLLKEQVFSDLAPYGGTRSSPRNIVEYKGSLYLTIYNDSGMNGAILYKISYVETNIDLPSKSYLVTGSSIVLENEKPILKIQGSLSDLTKEDFNLTLLALKENWEYTLENFDMEINGGAFIVKYDLSKLSSQYEYIFFFNKVDEQTYDDGGNLRDGKSFIVPTETVTYNGFNYIGSDIWGHAGLKIQKYQVHEDTISYNSYRLENIDAKAIFTINANIDLEDMSKLKCVIVRFTSWVSSSLEYEIKKLDDGTYDVSIDISNVEIDGKTADNLNGGYFVELDTDTIKDNKVQLGDGLDPITIGNRTYSFEEFYGNLKIVIASVN